MYLRRVRFACTLLRVRDPMCCLTFYVQEFCIRTRVVKLSSFQTFRGMSTELMQSALLHTCTKAFIMFIP